MSEPSSEARPTAPAEQKSEGKAGFLSELKRRKVFRVAITYAVVAWIIIQIAATTFSGFGIPQWAFRFVAIMLILGFPIALIITWAFELTPEGVKLTQNVTSKDRERSSQTKRNRMAFLFASGLPTLIFGTLAAFFYFTRGVPNLEAADKSIAVLPFRNVSADSGNEYFCDGVQEDILTTLANIGDLQVISRTSVMRYKDTEKTIPEIGLELGVSYILEGSVQRSGGRVRVTGQLINARTDEHLWAKNYDRELTDIFAIQAEISKEIAHSLRAVLSPEEVALIDHQKSVHPAAYDLVLKGRSLQWNISLDAEEMMDRTEVLFQAATEMDSGYADAWVELAYVHVRKYFTNADSSEDRLEKAKAAIDKAVELDPISAKVLIGLGNYFYYGYNDYVNARIQYEKALARSPNNAEALASLGYISRREGKWGDTLEYFKQSFQLDPNNVILADNYHGLLFNYRMYKEAESISRHLAKLAPDDPFSELRTRIDQAYAQGDPTPVSTYVNAITPQQMEEDRGYFFTKIRHAIANSDIEQIIKLWEQYRPEKFELNYFHYYYGLALNLLGRTEEARKVWDEIEPEIIKLMEENPGNEGYQMGYARICAIMGRREKVYEIIDTLKEPVLAKDKLMYNDEYLRMKYRSLILLGEFEAALDTLESMLDLPYGLHYLDLKSHLRFYKLRDHPRFKELLDDPRLRQPVSINTTPI